MNTNQEASHPDPKASQPDLETLVALAKRRGFVYQTSEIYGGLANSYDYGPLGVELLRAIRETWWQVFVTKRPDVVGLDTQILLHPKTWEASGHTSSFKEALVEDKVTHQRYRADHLIEDWLEANSADHPDKNILSQLVVEDMSVADMAQFLKKYSVTSPEGNLVTEPKLFDLLFETAIGSVKDQKTKLYLRGETAQGLFSNFRQVLDSTRIQLPFGIANIGKAFRNEVTTGQFVFRTLEFEQAELEYFFDPQATKWQTLLKEWQDELWSFVTKSLGVSDKNLRWREHTDQERSHYSQSTYDLDYRFPFGWKELWGLAYRTDYDLKQHMKYSGQSLEYRDPKTGRAFVPHVIEPAVGVNRLFLMVLNDAYHYDPDKKRVVLKLKPSLAPYTLAISPLLKNKPELVKKARQIFDHLNQASNLRLTWDDRGNIGKRYLYQDEIGTPFCLTVDFQTLKDQTVTIRNRDTADQERVAEDKVKSYLENSIEEAV